MKLLAKITIVYSLLSIFMLTSCNYFDYLKAVKKETQERFIRDKGYIYRLTFEGKITRKTYCTACEINKYELTLELKKISEKPTFSLAQYPPYYTFLNDSVVNVSVSRELFERVSEQDHVIKDKDSFNLMVDSEELLFLSKEKLKWFP
ncbi:hypothetical protein EYV94_16430 [Puteibacter caeruleilacunae]|nr:hypothetical protein EYV94_16430 [Puteibacter caeruleilacunae]